MTHIKKKAVIRNQCENDPSVVTDKDFDVTIINIFKDLKGDTCKLNEQMGIVAEK